jgi:hypothetical protein
LVGYRFALIRREATDLETDLWTSAEPEVRKQAFAHESISGAANKIGLEMVVSQFESQFTESGLAFLYAQRPA